MNNENKMFLHISKFFPIKTNENFLIDVSYQEKREQKNYSIILGYKKEEMSAFICLD
jgi:hypothetical protein